MDLPTEEQTPEEQGPSPIMATIEAMQRLKARNDQQAEIISNLVTRVENLEKAFERAFKNGAASLQEFLENLDSKDVADANGKSKSEENQNESDEIATAD